MEWQNSSCCQSYASLCGASVSGTPPDAVTLVDIGQAIAGFMEMADSAFKKPVEGSAGKNFFREHASKSLSDNSTHTRDLDRSHEPATAGSGAESAEVKHETPSTETTPLARSESNLAHLRSEEEEKLCLGLDLSLGMGSSPGTPGSHKRKSSVPTGAEALSLSALDRTTSLPVLPKEVSSDPLQPRKVVKASEAPLTLQRSLSGQNFQTSKGKKKEWLGLPSQSEEKVSPSAGKFPPGKKGGQNGSPGSKNKARNSESEADKTAVKRQRVSEAGRKGGAFDTSSPGGPMKVSGEAAKVARQAALQRLRRQKQSRGGSTAGAEQAAPEQQGTVSPSSGPERTTSDSEQLRSGQQSGSGVTRQNSGGFAEVESQASPTPPLDEATKAELLARVRQAVREQAARKAAAAAGGGSESSPEGIPPLAPFSTPPLPGFLEALLPPFLPLTPLAPTRSLPSRFSLGGLVPPQHPLITGLPTASLRSPPPKPPLLRHNSAFEIVAPIARRSPVPIKMPPQSTEGTPAPASSPGGESSEAKEPPSIESLPFYSSLIRTKSGFRLGAEATAEVGSPAGPSSTSSIAAPIPLKLGAQAEGDNPSPSGLGRLPRESSGFTAFVPDRPHTGSVQAASSLISGGFAGGRSSPGELPWVMCTGADGTNVTGVLYSAGQGAVKIVCVCHGLNMSPAEFASHAGNVEFPDNPARAIKVGFAARSTSSVPTSGAVTSSA